LAYNIEDKLSLECLIKTRDASPYISFPNKQSGQFQNVET